MNEYLQITLPGQRIYNTSSIEAQVFTVADINKIFVATQTNNDKQLYDVLNSRIKGVDIYDLTQQDLKYYLAWQLENSYPDVNLIPPRCSNCGETNLPKITMDMLTGEAGKDLPEEYNHNGTEYQLDNFCDNSIVKLRLPIIKDEFESKEFSEKHNIDKSNVCYIMVACMLEHHGGSLEERYDLVEKNLTPHDYALITSFEDYFDYGLGSTVKVKCPDCGSNEEVLVEINLMSFFPSDNYGGDVRARILSNKPTADTTVGNKQDDLPEGKLVAEKEDKRPEGLTEQRTVKDIVNNRNTN